MEYCPSSLAKESDAFDEERLKALVRDVALGLHQLHSQNIVHLNLKPRMTNDVEDL